MKKAILIMVLLVTTLSLVLILASFRMVQTEENQTSVQYEGVSVNLPDAAEYITDLKTMPDGTIYVIAGSIREKDVICYMSQDSGKTWVELERYRSKLPLKIQESDYVEGYGYLAEDSSVGIYMGIASNKTRQEAQEDASDLDLVNYNFIVQPDGSVVSIENETIKKQTCYKMHFSGDSCYLEDIQGNLYEVDRVKGSWKGIASHYDTVDLLNGKILSNEDYLYEVDSKKIVTVKKENDQDLMQTTVFQKLQNHIQSDSFEKQYVIASNEDLTVVYYGDKQGIWKISKNGELCCISGKELRYVIGKGDLRNMIVQDDGSIILAISTMSGESSIVRYQQVQ